jgi:hypothetical protein
VNTTHNRAQLRLPLEAEVTRANEERIKKKQQEIEEERKMLQEEMTNFRQGLDKQFADKVTVGSSSNMRQLMIAHIDLYLLF